MILPSPKPHLVWIDPVPPAPTIFRVRKRQFAFAESGDTKAISQTGFGKNTADFCRIITNLGTRLANINPQILAVIGMCRAPDRAQDHGLGTNRPAWLASIHKRSNSLRASFRFTQAFSTRCAAASICKSAIWMMMFARHLRSARATGCADALVILAFQTALRRNPARLHPALQPCPPHLPAPKAPEPAPVTIPGWRAAR